VQKFYDRYSYKLPLYSLYRDLALYLNTILAYTFGSYANGSNNKDIAEGSIARRANLLEEAYRNTSLGSKSRGRLVDLKQLGEVRHSVSIDTQARRHTYSPSALGHVAGPSLSP